MACSHDAQDIIESSSLWRYRVAPVWRGQESGAEVTARSTVRRKAAMGRSAAC
jgi:hypothetical protein